MTERAHLSRREFVAAGFGAALSAGTETTRCKRAISGIKLRHGNRNFGSASRSFGPAIGFAQAQQTSRGLRG
jgi:hypothetical protein